MGHDSGRLLAGAALLLLAGCGSEAGERAAEPTPPPTDAPAATAPVAPGPVEITRVALVSGSNAGGAVSERATPLPDVEAVRELTAGLTDEQLVLEVEQEVAQADVPEGQALAGAVVAIGCEPPTEVRAELTGAGLSVIAIPAKSPAKSTTQCLVPVTTVAVVSVREEAVGQGAR